MSMLARLRRMLVIENRLGTLDPEIYPTVIVSLGTAAWGALILWRKARAEFPKPARADDDASFSQD